ncbi:hypothetical protein YC2023_105385 [Brassica napus]
MAGHKFSEIEGQLSSQLSGREEIKRKTKRGTTRRGGTSCFPNRFCFSEALSNYIFFPKMENQITVNKTNNPGNNNYKA